jgi:drug/metabolite transporter (DMT)-like permease
MKKSRLDNPYLLMSILLVLWGSFAAVSKMALTMLDYYQVQFYMFGSAVVIFTVMFSLNGRIKSLFTLRPKEMAKLLLYGLPNYLYYLFYILSLGLIPVIEASMLNYMFPIFIVLLSVPMFGESLTLAKGFSILLGFIGMMAIVSNGDITAIRLTNLGGDLLALGAALSWALFSGLGRKNKVDQDLSIYVFTLSAFAFSSIGLVGFSTFTVPNITSLGWAVCLGISNIVLGSFLWIRGLKSSSSSLIASLSYLTPFVTLLFIIVMLGERLSVPQTVGFLIISAGIVIQVITDKIAVRSHSNKITDCQ